MSGAAGSVLAMAWTLVQDEASAGDDASSQLTLVIYALLLLAVVIAVVTVLFWRSTRPGDRRRRG